MAADPACGDDCALCGRPLGETAVTGADDLRFCCRGCADVDDRLAEDHVDDRIAGDDRGGDGGGTATGRNAGASTDRDRGDGGGDGTLPPGTERTFLRVDGMHAPTCEAYLESVALARDGVVAASASYVTETVRIDHDPDELSTDDLVAALSTTGYTAVPRAAATPDDGTGPGEPAPTPADRGIDDLLGFRYVAGVVFGSFMLLPYVLVFYPVHVAGLLGTQLPGADGPAGGLAGDVVVVLPMFFTLTGVVLFFTGAPLLRGAVVSFRLRRPNTDLLVVLAVGSAFVYSTLALALGRIDVYYDLTIVIAAGVVAATYYESLVKQRAVGRLADRTVSRVEEARLYGAGDTGGATETVPISALDAGDRMLVRAGERIPVDGVLAEGECTVDEAVVTGESLPVHRRAGDELVGGSLVTADAAVVEVGEGATSGVERLASAVWSHQSADHGVQRRADELAGVVVPVVAVLAVVVGAAALALGEPVATAALASLTVPLVASPWVLGLARPLSVATTVADALERGIVVFDESVLERLRSVAVVVVDKTGTLTTGEMTVVDADAPDEALSAAAALERRGSHPAAAAIAAALGDGAGNESGGAALSERGDGGGDALTVEAFETRPRGVSGRVDGTSVTVGHPDTFHDRGWTVPDDLASRARRIRDEGQLPVLVGREGRAEGIVTLGDQPRAGWAGTLSDLDGRGVDVVVLTGDDAAATTRYREHPAVAEVFAGVPPAGKTETVRRLRSRGRVAMVGDGTNDAPALAAADLGISMGGGTALASDAADLAILDDDLGRVETAFELAHAARRRVVRNDRLALVYNAIAVPVVLAGLLSPLTAIAAVAASGGLVAANSTRDLLDG